MLLLIIVCDFACERALSHQYFEQRRTHKAGSIPAGVYGWPPSYFCMCATDTRFSSTATLTIHLSWWGNNAISYKSSFHSAIVVLEKVASVCWLIYLFKTYMVGCWNLKLTQKIYPIFISTRKCLSVVTYFVWNGLNSNKQVKSQLTKKVCIEDELVLPEKDKWGLLEEMISYWHCPFFTHFISGHEVMH